MNGIKCQTEEFLFDPLAIVSHRWTFFFFFWSENVWCALEVKLEVGKAGKMKD